MSELRNQYGVASLGVFGSYVRAESYTQSDLDLLVDFSDPPSLFGFLELRDHLSKVLGMKVDLVMKTALKAGIGKRILGEVVAI